MLIPSSAPFFIAVMDISTCPTFVAGGQPLLNMEKLALRHAVSNSCRLSRPVTVVQLLASGDWISQKLAHASWLLAGMPVTLHFFWPLAASQLPIYPPLATPIYFHRYWACQLCHSRTNTNSMQFYCLHNRFPTKHKYAIKILLNGVIIEMFEFNYSTI